jgi:hypothetical protein
MNEVSELDISQEKQLIDKIEYLRNVFLKYLELKYTTTDLANETYQKTIEQVLMAELNFTFE